MPSKKKKGKAKKILPIKAKSVLDIIRGDVQFLITYSKDLTCFLRKKQKLPIPSW